MKETTEATSPAATTLTVSMPHDCIVVKSSATERGGGKETSRVRVTAVITTAVDFSCTPFKPLRGNVDSLGKLMPRRLDYRLSQVAALRQITIKTARDWRDSENKKWATAITEIENLRCDQRKKKRQGKTVLPTLTAIRNLPSNHYTRDATPPRQPGPCEREILANNSRGSSA